MKKMALFSKNIPLLNPYQDALNEEENRRSLTLPLALCLSAVAFLTLPANQQTLGESLITQFLNSRPEKTLNVTIDETTVARPPKIIPAYLSSDAPLVERIIHYMKRQGYQVFVGKRHYNIVYIEGMNLDGTPNKNKPNQFNDLRLLIEVIEGKPRIVQKWEATTEPGIYYTENPQHEQGAFRIKPGQYKAWKVGYHWGNGGGEVHEALEQIKPISGYRDLHKTYQREGKLYTGLYDINQHHGSDVPVDNIGYYAAGCLVGRTIKGHQEFMSLLKQDVRYQKDPNFLFTTSVILADALVENN
jgi:hypothetical protein